MEGKPETQNIPRCKPCGSSHAETYYGSDHGTCRQPAQHSEVKWRETYVGQIPSILHVDSASSLRGSSMCVF